MFGGGFLLTLSGVASNVADQLDEWAVGPIGEAGTRAVPPAEPSEAERIKEKELLDALVRCGKLSTVGASLESSLSVEEA